MNSLKHFGSYAAIIGLALAPATGALAQISSINSAVIQSRVFNDVPGATFTGVNNYPALISLREQGVSATNGFANRDQWRFSNNGSSPYPLQHNDYFSASFTLNLTGTPIAPRKE